MGSMRTTNADQASKTRAGHTYLVGEQKFHRVPITGAKMIALAEKDTSEKDEELTAAQQMAKSIRDLYEELADVLVHEESGEPADPEFLLEHLELEDAQAWQTELFNRKPGPPPSA